MWVEPNSHVQILQNVPLDKDFNNTIYFASQEAQHSYFANKTKRTTSGRLLYFDHVTYQRVRRNYMRLDVNAEELYDCNYLMFQNTAFGSSRWFYAFIVGTEYVANNVTEIQYILDPMQTWFLFDCTMLQSYVEREHIAVDSFGANRVIEDIEAGDYILANLSSSGDRSILNRQCIVIATTATVTSGTIAGHVDDSLPMMNGNIMGMLQYYVYPFNFDDTDAEKIHQLSKVYNKIYVLTERNRSESIVKIFQCPFYFFRNIGINTETGEWEDYEDTNTIKVADAYTFNYSVNRPTSLGSYTNIHNRKLLQYPYNFLYVTDCRGTTGTYLWEDSNHSEIAFKYTLTGSCDPSMSITPIDYKINGATSYENLNYDNQMILKGYPECSYSIDGFLAYLAQNGGVIPTVANDIVSPVANAVSAFSGYSVGRMKDNSILTNNWWRGRVGDAEKNLYSKAIGIHDIAGKTSAVSRVLSDMGSFVAKMNTPSTAKGNFNGDVSYTNGLFDFQYAQKCIYPQNAERIDKFFDMYGYATKTIKTPNINSREHWNYVKLINPNIVGNIPADDLEDIKSIFEKGITFWKNANEVGNYTLDNWTNAWG